MCIFSTGKTKYRHSLFSPIGYEVVPLFALKGNQLDLLKEFLDNPESRSRIKVTLNEKRTQIINVEEIEQ